MPRAPQNARFASFFAEVAGTTQYGDYDGLLGSVKQKVLPCSLPSDSTQTRPPCTSTIHLEIDLDSADPVVLGDAQRIEQVLDHLLANAAKFTDAGRVAVRTRSAGDEVLIEVADTGIGIEQAHLDKLFTPFLQEDNRLNRRYQGVGLGLALVKRLLDVMGGRIEVDSEKGKGATFRVFLPAAE